MHTRSRLWVFRSALLLLLAGSLFELLALAGGGSGYSGGGGGSSGGGGGEAEGLFWILYFLIRLSIHHPTIGIPLLIVFVVGMWFYYTQIHDKHVERTIQRGNRVRDLRAEGAVLARIAASDPDFDHRGFERRVREAFLKIQDAWCAHKLDRVRLFCSDGIITRWQVQLAEQRAHRYRDQVEAIQVHGATIVDLHEDDHFQEITVSIHGTCSDYRVDYNSGRPVSGVDKNPKPFKEYWSFIRRLGAKTLSSGKPGLIEGNCPSCGAKIQGNQNVSCEYCGAVVKSGTYDWVLAEITQPSEWQARNNQRITGVQAMLAKDPAWNAQHVEDATSVAFYRHRSCQRLQNTTPIAGTSTPHFVQGVEKVLAEKKDVAWATATDQSLAQTLEDGRYLAEFAIGGVDVVASAAGSAPIANAEQHHFDISKDYDGVLVEVRWSGVVWQRPGTGRAQGSRYPVRGTPTAPRKHAYYFTRQSSAQTKLDDAMTSAHCPSCGAPTTDDDSAGAGASCAYCGASLNDGHAQWVLTGVFAWTDPFVRNFINHARSGPAGATGPAPAGLVPPVVLPDQQSASTGPIAAADDILLWAVAVAKSDGVIEAKEKHALEALRVKLGCHPAVLQQALEAPVEEAEHMPQPSDNAEAKQWIMYLCEVAWADGTVDMSERQTLRQIGQAAGILPYDVNVMIRTARKQAMQEARASIREG